jgi:hypothetical protein
MRAIASYLPFSFLLALGALPTNGCARKLPGPAECRAFALASLEIEPGTPASLLAAEPQLAARAEELTNRCLTTPWDYPLLNCLGAGGSSRVCLSRFEARRLRAQ